ncbi:MAG: hypothetical protein JNJ57_00330 [Saprospiraceae bacterium]|nr:hypothetical protein [Saprospiraceae bacterium]
MKSYTWISVVCLLAIHCEKEKPDVGVNLGESMFLLNDSSRAPKTERMFHNTTIPDAFDLDFSVFDPSGVWPVESFYIFKIPKKTGKFQLERTTTQDNDNKTGAFYYTLSDQGDVLEEVYILEESADNFIDVTYYQQETSAGSFNATFIIDPDRGKTNPSSPDTIRITHGEFYLKLE